MQITCDEIERATTTEEVARIMRLLSEDVLEAMYEGTLPNGDGKGLEWHHPNGFEVTICEASDEPDSTDYNVSVSAGIVTLIGGFSLFNAEDAEALDCLIEGVELD